MLKHNLKQKAKFYIVQFLNYLSRQKLAKHNPYIVGITGNVGKTTTKDYIFTVLKENGLQVRATQKSFNSEFGVPLTILGEDNPWDNVFGWIKIILKHFALNILPEKYPKVLVLEIGADAPMDIYNITQIVKPNTVVLTAFAEHPVHAEFFPSRERHLREKQYLVDALSEKGTLIYNADDKDMISLADTHATHNKISFGKFSEDLKLLNTQISYDEKDRPIGVKTVFVVDNVQQDITLYGVLGNSHAYAMLAAVATGLTFNLDIKNIIKSFEEVVLPKSRLRLFSGLNDSIIIDDTYNASPKAAMLTIETLKQIKSQKKKYIILGHMAELGESAESDHKKVAKAAAEIADGVLLVGRHNDWYLNGLREAKLDMEKVFLSQDVDEAVRILDANFNFAEGDIIMLKGSQSARIEKVAVRLLKNKKDIKQICRQEKEWQDR